MSKNELPRGSQIAPETIGKNFSQVRILSPLGDEQLGVTLLVPKSWYRSSPPNASDGRVLSSAEPEQIGLFLGGEYQGATPIIEVRAIRLLRTIRASHWLRHYCERTNRVLSSHDDLSPSLADGLAEFVHDGTGHTGRVAVQIDRDHLFLLNAYCASEAYPDLEQMFGVVVGSLQLLFPAREAEDDQIEARSTVVLPGLEFDFPSGLQVVASPESDRWEAFNFDSSQEVQGIFTAKAIDKSERGFDRNIAFKNLKAKINKSTLQPGEQIVRRPMETADGLFNGHLESYKALIEGNLMVSQELWLMQFESRHYCYQFTLLTPSRDDLFYSWAINRRALDIITGSCRKK